MCGGGGPPGAQEWLSSGYEGAINGAFGVSIFPIYSLLWGASWSYLEFSNHLIAGQNCLILMDSVLKGHSLLEAWMES